jgi:hypothetical protein
MMAERGFEVDHSSVHRWVIKLLLFEKAFRRHKRPVGKSWRMNETYLKEYRHCHPGSSRNQRPRAVLIASLEQSNERGLFVCHTGHTPAQHLCGHRRCRHDVWLGLSVTAICIAVATPLLNAVSIIILMCNDHSATPNPIHLRSRRGRRSRAGHHSGA